MLDTSHRTAGRVKAIEPVVLNLGKIEQAVLDYGLELVYASPVVGANEARVMLTIEGTAHMADVKGLEDALKRLGWDAEINRFDDGSVQGVLVTR